MPLTQDIRKIALLVNASIPDADRQLLEAGISPLGLIYRGAGKWQFGHCRNWSDWQRKLFSRAFFDLVEQTLQQGVERVEFASAEASPLLLGAVSTSHMQLRDSQLLERGVRPQGLLFKGEYGYQFSAQIDEADWSAKGFSPEFFRNAKAVLDSGFDRVEFDQDAEPVEGLPVFCW